MSVSVVKKKAFQKELLENIHTVFVYIQKISLSSFVAIFSVSDEQMRNILYVFIVLEKEWV